MKVKIGNYPKTGQRKVKVKIHSYDLWNMDNTVALIVLPLLKALKEAKQGIPSVDYVDVPEDIRKIVETEQFKTEHPNSVYETAAHCKEFWNYVLDEIIWSFECIVNADELWSKETLEQSKIREERQANGLRLFGKYLTSMWI